MSARRDGSVFDLLVAFGFAACGVVSPSGAVEPKASGESGAKATDASASASPESGAAVPTVPGPMNSEQAHRYVLALVNRDRAQNGLSALTLDDAATRAGQRHADDMARAGYTAHWGTDGSVPEQRYSEAGGTDFVQENAGCLADGKPRKLEAAPRFSAAQLERVERAFMDEKPPHDGHRKNILKASHSALGVGVSKPSGVELACLSQEFVDDFGDYAPLPRAASIGNTLHVEGDVKGGVRFGGIGIARIEPQKPLSAAYLNTTYVYTVPSPGDLYFPKGYVTKRPVTVSGQHFRIDVPLADAGRYEVSIWAKFPGAGEQLDMISLRVVSVE